MIIEQVEALKSWLTLKLSPICDAEPSALAKYVCALVKKDKPEQDLKDICMDQLDVFLQLKTKPFVDELFEALKTKSYIPPAEKKTTPATVAPNRIEGKAASHQGEKEKEDATKKKLSEISSTTDDKEAKETHGKEKESAGDSSNSSKEPGREVREPRALSRDGRDRDGDRDRRDSWKDERSRDGIRDARDIIREREREGVRDRDTREVREPRDRDHRDRERDFRRRRTRSRSFSPRRREFDDRIRRRYDDRPRHSPDRRWGRRRSWSRSPRRRSPIDRTLVRLRSRSPRLRSRSPRLRSRSPRYRSFRSRTRSRSRSPGLRSWSRPGSASGGRPRSPSNTVRQPDSRGSTPVQDNDYSTLISSSTNDLPAITSTVGLRPAGDEKPDRPISDIPISLGQGPRTRCINFEEKGYCTLGDMCPYDHGTNPVVVEDVPITNVVAGNRPMSGPTNTGPGFVPPDLRIPPPGHMAVRMTMRQPPPNLVEPYMPEAPGLREPLRPSFLRGMGPHIRPPPPGMMMNRPPLDPMFPPQREVIMGTLPPSDNDDLDTLIADKEPSRIVIPAKRPYSAIDPHLGPPPPRMAHINQNHHMFVQRVGQPFHPRMSHPGKKGFDYNRLGGGGFRHGSRPPFKTGNLTLEVRKIPAELNNIAKINEHFGKFGTLTNIQVKYQGDPGAALISFSNNGEATAAYKSPEPVFNNRFIKLFWHDPGKASEEGGKGTENTAVTSGIGITLRSGGRVGDGIDHPSLVLPSRSNIPSAHKYQLDNTRPKLSGDAPPPSSESPAGTEQSLVYSSSLGHIKKTVHNAGAVTPSKAKSGTALTSPTTTKPSDFVSRIEAIKRAEENKKQAIVKQAELDAKKQDLLAKQIHQQKLLIETLDKKKGTMSEKERANLLKALKTISDAIDKVKYGTGTKKNATFQAPAPAQLRFVSQEQAHAKEMQDLDQEVMTRQKRGEDTTALRMKLMDLANKQQNLGFPYGRGRGWSSNRGSPWAPRGRGRGAMTALGRTSIDNRPKTLEVKNFDLEEIEEIKTHFQQFGDLDRVELMEDPPSLWITFAARPTAEVALNQGAKFNNKILSLKWSEAQKFPQRESIQSSDLDDEDLSVSLGSIEEEALLKFKAEDNKSVSDSDNTDTKPATPTEAPEDSRSVVTKQDQEDASPPTISTNYQRTLSEDLLLGDEHNFKASYTDDEEEDDHITVTVSNTVNSGSWVYAKSDATLEDQTGGKEEEGDDTDLDNLANSEITFTEDDGSSWA